MPGEGSTRTSNASPKGGGSGLRSGKTATTISKKKEKPHDNNVTHANGRTRSSHRKAQCIINRSKRGARTCVATLGGYGPSLPVIEGSRAIRLEAVELLPAIIAELNREIRNKIDAIREGMEAALQL